MINDMLKDYELNISYKFWCFIGRDHMVYCASLCASREMYRRNVLSMAENKLYSQDFGVKSWIFFIIGISIVYVKIKLYTKFEAKMLNRSKVMID